MGCAEYISVLIKQRDEARAALVADMRTRGWYAFCREHQQKVNDRCPRCELEALRAAHAPQPEPEP
jgi:valyl-tRNA synthetase